MPCRVLITATYDLTAVTATDRITNSLCFDKNSKKNIENLPLASKDTFDTSVELRNGKGRISIEATDASATNSYRYEIPADCDAEGKINIPKNEAASQNDLENLRQEVQDLERRIAGGAPP